MGGGASVDEKTKPNENDSPRRPSTPKIKQIPVAPAPGARKDYYEEDEFDKPQPISRQNSNDNRRKSKVQDRDTFQPGRDNPRNNPIRPEQPKEENTPQYGFFPRAQNKERVELAARLDEIADELRDQPPSTVQNSQSYSRAFQYYSARCKPQSEMELNNWFEQEKATVKHETLEHLLNTKTNSDDETRATRETQLSEYKLRLGALVKIYRDHKIEYDTQKKHLNKEKEEDLNFLYGMIERVESDSLQRPGVISSIDQYSAECRKKILNSRGNTANGNVNKPPAGRQTSVPLNGIDDYGAYPSTTLNNRYEHQQLPPNFRDQVDLQAEANGVLNDGKRNARKHDEVRKYERALLNNELNSRAASVIQTTHY